ncbi:unnamed protein product [Cylindrotheca closterium]|uniref:Uncharacterized protein n=1 Tax=Cylindrotheca closterium TaxID=2856 RepID=A0AAD2CQH0_9STRA|nr:unnamed protein product [Cylindrotheca closterium]
MKDMKYKDDLIEKIGGQSQYEFVVIEYCENIQKDHRLEYFFGHLDLQELIQLQKQFLDAVFLDVTEKEATTLKNQLMIKYYGLWHMGMNERYFEVLEGHFSETLRDCWVEESLLQQCQKRFEELRPLFEQSGQIALDGCKQNLGKHVGHNTIATA